MIFIGHPEYLVGKGMMVTFQKGKSFTAGVTGLPCRREVWTPSENGKELCGYANVYAIYEMKACDLYLYERLIDISYHPDRRSSEAIVKHLGVTGRQRIYAILFEMA